MKTLCLTIALSIGMIIPVNANVKGFSFNIGPNGFDIRINKGKRHWNNSQRRERCRRRARRHCSYWRQEYMNFGDRWYLRHYRKCKSNFRYMCTHS